MLARIPPKYRRHCPGRPAAARTPVGPLEVVGVEDVYIHISFLSLTVVFDTTAEAPLVDPSSADPGKWNVRYLGRFYNVDSLTLLDFNKIEIDATVDSGQLGLNQLFYGNSPSDISDVLGRQLGAFIWTIV